MNTKIKFLALIFAVLSIIALLTPNNVFASEVIEVANLEELQEALEDETITGEIKLTETIKIEESVTIKGNNKTITTAKAKAFEIHTGEVEFQNLTIINSAANGRCIDVRDGDVSLTLENVNLKATSKSHNQPLTIGASFSQTVPITLKNTTIEAGPDGWGYAVIIFNPVKLNIENSNITGYTSLYFKSETEGGTGTTGSTVSVNNSSLTGKYELAVNEPSNSFATIVFNDSGINVDINNSKLYAIGALEKVIGEYKGMAITEKHNKVTISGNSVISTQQLIAGMKDPDATVILNEGVKSNVEIPEKLLPAGAAVKQENGKYVVYIPKEIDFVIPDDKTEDNNIGIIETEKVKETLDTSLKADTQLNEKVEEATKKGEAVKVEIKMEALKNDTVKEEEKQLILQNVRPNQKVHQYFDISVLVTADQIELGKLTQLTDKIKFSIEISKDLIQDGRTFYILKLHNGEVKRIDGVLNGMNLEFKTDEFSTFALAYEDIETSGSVEPEQEPSKDVSNGEKDETPKTGEINIPTYVWISIAGIALIGLATTKKSSKHSK